jgi:GntR family transcriptional repressor for pyruvate dehydrogenase complex
MPELNPRARKSPARRRKRYEEIAEHIELQILSDRLGEGGRLPSERELMERFGVGRSTVREALFSLQRMGLVEVMSGAPARITRPTADSIIGALAGAARHFLATPIGVRHFQHARLLFEVGLARDAASRADDTKIARLAAALDANRRSIGDQTSFLQTDLDFHFTLAEISGNPIFTSVNVALNDWLGKQREMSVRGGATQSSAYAQHAAIFDAIAARDPIRAQQTVEAHLTTVARQYWTGVEADARSALPPVQVNL